MDTPQKDGTFRYLQTKKSKKKNREPPQEIHNTKGTTKVNRQGLKRL